MKIKIALDSPPNALHAGLLLAGAKGYFKDQNLDVEIINPAEVGDAEDPIEKLADKQVHIALGPSESVIHYNTLGNKSVPLIAIAAMLQEDTNAIAILKDSGIERPAQLDGKTVGLHGVRFEDDIVKQMIIKDGGVGNFRMKKLKRAEMWSGLMNRAVDATWISLPWEGLRAEYEENLQLNVFQLRDFDIPYGYALLLITHQDFIRDENQMLRAFLRAVEKGWQDIFDDPEKSAKRMSKDVKYPGFKEKVVLRKSLEMMEPILFHKERDRWGFMEGYHWLDFVEWMINAKVLKNTDGIPMNHGQIDTAMLYTNEFFK